jgi:hypothetical protein
MRALTASLCALAFVATAAPALAYTQADADACTPDAFRLCQDAIPNEARVGQCLFAKKKQLSPACAAVFSRPQAASGERERRPAFQPARF